MKISTISNDLSQLVKNPTHCSGEKIVELVLHIISHPNTSDHAVNEVKYRSCIEKDNVKDLEIILVPFRGDLHA